MHRFFITDAAAWPMAGAQAGSPLDAGQRLALPEKIAHQVRDVLHLAVGETLVLLDNSGDELLCAVTKSGRSGVEVEVVERRAGQSEASVRVILCQGLLKSARFEWILEKGTELGVAVFAPILCRRSTSGLEEAGSSKIQRWQRIVQEAAEQCGRARLPELWPIRPFAHALNELPEGALALMPWEEERALSLRDTLRAAQTSRAGGQAHTVALFIGPEGGLAAEEVSLARGHGVQVVTLGTRILRAETAALSVVANVLYELL
jgi:16S rRNA (uracil1498-N3)-methyltransferase